MKLYIPSCGSQLTLSNDWQFKLYCELRNEVLYNIVNGTPGKQYHYSNIPDPIDLTLPANTTLEIDRIYIRTSSKSATSEKENYDSITFKIVQTTDKELKNKRFWVKLSEANNIEYKDTLSYSEVKSSKPIKKKKQFQWRKLFEELYGRWPNLDNYSYPYYDKSIVDFDRFTTDLMVLAIQIDEIVKIMCHINNQYKWMLREFRNKSTDSLRVSLRFFLQRANPTKIKHENDRSYRRIFLQEKGFEQKYYDLVFDKETDACIDLDLSGLK